VDIRTQGSGNAGGTNALRTQGWRFALGVALIDIAKGALAAGLGLALPAAGGPGAEAQGLACGLAAVLGHVWPLYFGFRGGKGAATLVGAIAVTAPLLLVPLLALWLLLLTSTGYVGLATVAAGLAAVPASVWLAPGDRALLAFAAAAAALVVFTHRANLQRLRTGTEHRFERARVLARWFGAR